MSKLSSLFASFCLRLRKVNSAALQKPTPKKSSNSTQSTAISRNSMSSGILVSAMSLLILDRRQAKRDRLYHQALVLRQRLVNSRKLLTLLQNRIYVLSKHVDTVMKVEE